MMLLLPACHIPPLRPPQPAPLVPPTYNGTTNPENSAQLGVVEFFNDPTLSRLVDQAVVNNRELKIMEEEIQVAKAEILGRSGAFLPFLNTGNTTVGLDKYGRYTLPGVGIHDDPYLPGQFLPNPLPNYLLGLNFFWQVDIWRELRNARDAAQRRYLAAIDRRNYFITRLVAEVADNYYGLMARDKRLENLDQIIKVQEQSLDIAKARFEATRGEGALPVKRFEAAVSKSYSQKFITRQEIVQVENRINFLLNRYPQPVERSAAQFYNLNFPLSIGVPAQLLQNRPDIRQAERELEATGFDVKVARAQFFPKFIVNGSVGYQAFDPRYLFLTPESLIGGVAGTLAQPVINFRGIRAQYLTANAKQLQAIYNYQKVILNAYTEVITRLAQVQNYGQSVTLKRRQVVSLEAAVSFANDRFQFAKIGYLEVLIAQRDLWDARFELIEARQEQLSGIVGVYQALGGGQLLTNVPKPLPPPPQPPPLADAP
jgi:multidrug efflux system outer membrane protein